MLYNSLLNREIIIAIFFRCINFFQGDMPTTGITTLLLTTEPNIDSELRHNEVRMAS